MGAPNQLDGQSLALATGSGAQVVRVAAEVIWMSLLLPLVSLLSRQLATRAPATVYGARRGKLERPNERDCGWLLELELDIWARR